MSVTTETGVEECYCTTCQTRCSRWELLFGPHVHHDALPIHVALTTTPSTLLREAELLFEKVQESYMKPFRLMRRQLNTSLDFLRTSYAEKQRALAQLQRELAELHAEMAQAAQAKALMQCNEDYQRQQLRSQAERLTHGLRVMSEAWQSNATKESCNENEKKGVRLLQDSEVRTTALQELAQLRRILDAAMDTLQPRGNKDESSQLSDRDISSEGKGLDVVQHRSLQACMYAGRSALHATRSETLLHDCLHAQKVHKAVTLQPYYSDADKQQPAAVDTEEAMNNNSNAHTATMEEITHRQHALRAELAAVIADIHRTIEQPPQIQAADT